MSIDAQVHRTSNIFNRMQNDVLDYKRKCIELETRNHALEQQVSIWKATAQNEMSTKRKADSAGTGSNLEGNESSNVTVAQLCSQLEQATATIEVQRLEIHRLQAESYRLKDETENRKLTFAAESRHYNDYLTNEHKKLVELWRNLLGLRRHLDDLKRSTEKDIGSARADFAKHLHNVHSACLNFSGNLRSVDTQTQLMVEREKNAREAVEEALRQKIHQLRELQISHEGHVEELHNRLADLVAERDRLQAALKEHDLRVQQQAVEISAVIELQNKLSVTREQLSSQKAQLETADAERRESEARANALRRERDDAVTECNYLRSKLTKLTEESERLETDRTNALAQVQEVANAAQKRLEQFVARLENEEDARIRAENEKKQRKAEQRSDEIGQYNQKISHLEEKIMALNVDITNLSSQLETVVNERDAQSKLNRELQSAVAQLREHSGETELDAEQLRGENSELRDALLRLQATNNAIDRDKNELMQQCGRLESEKRMLNDELAALHESLQRAQHDKVELEAEKSSVLQSLTLGESTKLNLLGDLDQANRKIDQAKSRIRMIEEENLSLKRQIADLEAAVHESRMNLNRLEEQYQIHSSELTCIIQERNKLLKENTILANRAEVAESNMDTERDFRMALLNEENSHAEELSRLNEQLQSVRETCNAEIIRLEHLHSNQLKQISMVNESDKRELLNRINHLQRDCDAAMQLAETNGQQRVELLLQERNSLANQLNDTISALIESNSEVDRLKRELSAKLEQQLDENFQLREQLRKFQQEISNLQNVEDKRSCEFDDQLTEVVKQRELILNEKEQLKIELDLSDQRNERLRADLMQSSNQLRDIEKQCDALQNELAELQRQVADKQLELITTSHSLEQAKLDLETSNAERSEIFVTLAETRAKLEEVIMQNEYFESQVEELKLVIHNADSHSEKVSNDASELAALVRQLQTDGESLRNRIKELETMETKSTKFMDEARAEISKLTAERNQLDQALCLANKEKSEHRLQRVEAEAKCETLSAELAQTVNQKQSIENNLIEINNSLLRYVNFTSLRIDGTTIASATCAEEVDIESIDAVLRTLASHLTTSEHQCDKIGQENAAIVAQMNELHEEIQQLQRQLKSADTQIHEKDVARKKFEEQLHSLQKNQEETQSKFDNDRRLFLDNIGQLEIRIKIKDSEIKSLTTQLTQVNARVAAYENERRHLRRAIDELERQLAQAELSRRSLESEIKRFQVLLSEREREIVLQKETNQTNSRQLSESDARIQSLQLNVEMLASKLHTSDQETANLREKLARQSDILNDNARVIGDLKKSIEISDAERKILLERVESIRNSLSESKRENLALAENSSQFEKDCLKKKTEQDSIIRQSSEQIAALENEVMQLQSELSASLMKNKSDKERLLKLVRQLDEAKRDNLELMQKAETDKSMLEATISELLKDIEVLKAALEAVECQLEKTKLEQSCKMRSFNEELKKQAKNFRSLVEQQAAKSKQQEDDYQMRINEYESQILSYKMQLDADKNFKQQFATTVMQKCDEMTDLRNAIKRTGGTHSSAFSAANQIKSHGSLQNLALKSSNCSESVNYRLSKH